jgi:phenylalanyl-tRNA synthetase beta chain
LIEEIARLHGYNRFANTLPAFSGSVVELPHASKERTVRRRLLAAGYTETVFSTFCSEKEAAIFAPQKRRSVPLGNPLSEEAGHLRPSLLPGMLAMLAHNLNHGVENVRLFEMGTVFSGTLERVAEQPALALGATGTLAASPHNAARALDFYDMKGAVEQMLAAFAAPVTFHAAAEDGGPLPAWLHPGRAARVAIAGATLGYFGQLAADEAAQRKLKQIVFAGEFDLQQLYGCALRQTTAQPLSRFPAVVRDFSFVFADSVRWEQIAGALAALNIAEMRAPQPMEIFRDAKGKAVPQGSYSLLVRVTFQSLERTLREDEIQSASEQVMDVLVRLGGVIRDGVNVIAPQRARQ